MGKNVHVTRRHNGDWAVITAGSERAVKLFQTQTEAIKFGRPIAENNQSELVIHNVHNIIRDKDSYGKDLCPPKDTKY